MNTANTDIEVIAWNELVATRKQVAAKAPVRSVVQAKYDSQEYIVELLAGASIRLSGIYANRAAPVAFDISFKVGDRAAYGGYNLTYTGTIVSIGPKTVTIATGMSKRTKRLDIATFCQENWDFDAAKIAKRNSEWMD